MTHSPGLYDDLSDEEYHADPALSSSGARKLLPPSCPARFRWERDNGQPPKDEFDFGKAAHAQVLGIGTEIILVQRTVKEKGKGDVLLDATDYKSASAQQHRDQIRAEGLVPLLAKDKATVDAMADAIRQHPIAAALLDPDHGRPEVSLFWHDEQYDVDRRARFDWLPEPSDGRLIVPDYKTTASAEPRSFAKSMANYGYHAQAAWYLDAVTALDLADDAAFVFIAQEKTPPYLVTVVEPDAEALRIGRVLNDRALQVFAECTATGTWPGYTTDVELISLPGWATYGMDTAA